MELRLWSEDDPPIVDRFLSDPGMMAYLGGPQSREQIVDAHRRYLATAAKGTGCMFAIVLEGDVAGTIGYWEKEWRGDAIYETGWSVFPEFQGRGLATRAAELIIHQARERQDRRFLHAFPTPDNAASNAVCRRLGFTNLGPVVFEYPPGNFEPSNDWRLDLFGTKP